MTTLAKVLIGAVPVIVVLVAAAFLTPPDFPLLARQFLLFAWAGIGIFLAEYLLFGPDLGRIAEAAGLVAPHWRAVAVALLVSLPMWLGLPLYGWFVGAPIGLNPDWPSILLGVILVNGLAEELIHRAFVFGHLRRERSFALAASISAAIFAAQHLYLMVTMGPVAGGASVLLALLLAFPLAFIYERSGNSLVAPAILHTSSNAPMMLLVTPAVAAQVILPYMAIVLASIYLTFVFHRWLVLEKTHSAIRS
jgi:membrane protease YdiL (CAAX protease family)